MYKTDMSDYNAIMRRNIYRILEEKREKDPKYTQTWLAEQIDVSVQQLNNNLRGRRGLARIFSKIAIALDVGIDDLLADENTADEKNLLSMYRETIRRDPTRRKYILDFLAFELQNSQKQDTISSVNGTDTRG